jgi:hypothetical protein
MYDRYEALLPNGDKIIRQEGELIPEGDLKVIVMVPRGRFLMVCLQTPKGNYVQEKINEEHLVSVMSTKNGKGIAEYDKKAREIIKLFTKEERAELEKERKAKTQPQPQTQPQRKVPSFD